MALKKEIIIEKKYGFPNFTSGGNCIKLCDSKKVIISDIWGFWDYVIKKNYSNKEMKVFMNSLLEQAKFFYKTAENSPVKSQPLLYYYSFLNFAKIVINLKFPYGITNAKYLHGISQNGSSKFSQATISISEKKTAPNTLIKNVSAELEDALNGRKILAKETLNVKELMNHCVGIHRTYSEIYNQKEIFCRLSEDKIIKYGKDLKFFSEVLCNREEYNKLITIGYNIIEKDGKYYWKESITMAQNNVTRSDYYNLSQLLRSKGIWYFLGSNGYVNYISTSNNGRYTPEFIIYNAMFYLGSITRYYPYLFDEIFSANEQWLMSEFLTTQPKQFLYLTTAKILSQDVLKAYSDF